MKKLIFIFPVVALAAFGIWKLSNHTNFSSTEKKSSVDIFSEEENDMEKGEEANRQMLESYYYPQTMAEVSAERQEYVAKNGHLDIGEHLQTNTRASYVSIGPASANAVDNSFNWGGRMLCIEQCPNNPQIMYAGGSTGGLWKSINRGVSWFNVKDDLPCPTVNTVETVGNNEIWFGTGAPAPNADGYFGIVTPNIGQVYRSTNNGATWSVVTIDATVTINWVSKIVRPLANGSHVWIATDKGLYFQSSVGGAFTRMTTSVYKDMTEVLVSLSSTNTYRILAGRQMNGTGVDYWSMNNDGTVYASGIATLPGAVTPLGEVHLASSLTSSHSNCYAFVGKTNGTYNGVWRSTDRGLTWVQRTTPTDVGSINGMGAIECARSSANTVYIQGFRNVLVSTDGGGVWNTGASIHEDLHDILVDYSTAGTVYYVTDGGIAKLSGTNLGTKAGLNKGIATNQIYFETLYPNNSNYLLINTQDNGSSYTSDLNNWVQFTSCDGISACFKGDSLYQNLVGIGGCFNIQKTIISNISAITQLPWVSTPTPSCSWLWSGELRNNGNDMYINDGINIVKATNGSQTWVSQGPGVASNNVNRYSVTASGKLYAGLSSTTSIPFIWRNGGSTTWNAPTNTLAFWGSKNVTDVEHRLGISTGDTVFVALSGTSGIRVARSTNGGSLFSDISTSLPSLINVRCLLPDPTNKNILYIGTDFGVYVTLNALATTPTWSSYNSGLPATCFVNDLKYMTTINSLIVATFSRGVWVGPGLFVRTEDGEEHVTTYAQQTETMDISIFPNPMQNDVNFSIRNIEDQARLQIFNSSGKLISEMEVPETLSHSIEFDMSNYATGLYIAKLSSSGKEITKKFIKM